MAETLQGVTQIFEDVFPLKTIASNVIPLLPIMLCLLNIRHFDNTFSL